MSATGTTTVAAAIADRLVRLGVRYVFGYPGGETLDLLEAFRAAGLEFVLTHHETAAAFAAAATGELTGVPGVCLATLGPGATNLVSGVAAAMLERAPLLAFTAQLPRARRETTTHQRLDLNDLFRPITKGSFRLEPGDALRTLEKGIRLATAQRPGPVHFEVASDVPAAPLTDSIGSGFFATEAQVVHVQGAADAAALSEAARRIAQSSRPVALVGAGALRVGQGTLTAFAEAASMPVIVTPKAKGLIAESHPLFAGVIEMLGKSVITEWLVDADLFVYIGFDPVELDMLWTYDTAGVLFDNVPDVDAYYHVDVAAIGAIGASLASLVSKPQYRSPEDDMPVHALAGGRAGAYGAAAAALCRNRVQACIGQRAPSPGLLSPAETITAVRASADAPDAIAVTDVGAHKMAIGQLWVTGQPNSFLMSNGQSSMGYGLPSALAAKLIASDRQVVAMIGDGGLAMYLGELATIARLGISLPIVVFVDRQLSLIRMGQERRQYQRYGVDLGQPDYEGLARSMGGYGKRVQSAAELQLEMTAAFARPTFSLLAVPIDDALYRV